MDTLEIHNVYVDITGIPFTVALQNDDRDVVENIRLGWIEVQNGVILGAIVAPHVIGQTSVNLADMFHGISDASLSTGLRVKPSSGLDVFIEAGTLLLPGIGWHTTPKSQNYYDVPQAGDESTPVILNIFNQLGNPVMAGQPTIPKNYDNAGVLEPLTGGEAVIHYLFFSASGYSLQLGTTPHADFRQAYKNLCDDYDHFQFAPGSNVSGRSIVLAQIVISNGALNFNNKSLADIVSTINNESGNTISPVDLTLVPQYLLNTVAAEDLTMGDELSMDINGHLQKYPASGGEGTSEFTTDDVDFHSSVFLNTANNQGIIVWRNATNTNQINFRTAQGEANGTVTYSPIGTMTVGNNVSVIRTCKITASMAGMIWADSNGVHLVVFWNNGVGSAPSYGTSQQLQSGTITDVDVCWADNESHIIGVFCYNGTAYNMYCEISGYNVSSPPYSAIGMINGTQCRCASEGGNVVVTTISGTSSNWREAAWDKPLWSTGRYDDQTSAVAQAGCTNHCGMQVQTGNILAQFENAGVLQTYTATYSSGSSMGTPTTYGDPITGEWGALIKTDSGIGYSVVLLDTGFIEIYEGTITGTYQHIYTSTFSAGVNAVSIGAIMFGAVFGIGVIDDHTWSNYVILIDSSVTRTDHFVAVAPSNITQGQRFDADIALPLITLPREYAPGTTYEYGPYKYQVITHNQAVIIIEATIIM